jgi:hypothetical protein
MQDPQSVGFGAKCAIHPDRVASRTCSRCGNFTCDECNVTGTEAMCPTCRGLVGGETFPFTRSNFTFDSIWNFAFERWKQEWVMLSVCVLIFVAVGFVVGLFNGVFQGIARVIIGERGGAAAQGIIIGVSTLMSQVISTLVQGAFQMGLFRIYIDVLNGRKADVNRLFSQLPKLGRYILQTLLIVFVAIVPLLLYLGLLAVVAAAASGASLAHLDHLGRDFKPIAAVILILGFLALIPVMIYFGLPLQFATMELVYGDTQPMESIRRAFKITDGFRLSIFGFGFIAGLIAMVGVFACCVGVLPAVALSQLILTSLYLALRNGSGLPPPPEP